jgi:lysozyme-like protein
MAITDVQIANCAKAAGFSGSDLPIAIAIALAESGGNPTATHKNNNGSTDYGLFQINSIHSDLLGQNNWSDPAANARMAYSIFVQSNKTFNPWSTYKSGSYLRFLVRSRKAAPNASGNVPSGTLEIPATDNPGAGTKSGLGALSAFGVFISDGHNYVRVGYFLAGFVLVGMALLQLTSLDNKVFSAAKNIAQTAIVPESKILSVAAKAAKK